MRSTILPGIANSGGLRTCFIHIGTHKTGSTSIQAFLRDNRRLFAEHGVLIPSSLKSESDAGHHNVAIQLLDAPTFVPELGGLAELTEELKGSELGTACISSEIFSQFARRPQALVRLRDSIVEAGFRPVPVVYLRPQAAYIVSIYAELIKNGLLKPFDAYLREILEHGSFFWGELSDIAFHYDRLLDAFATTFGASTIVARRYRSAARNDALLESFAALLFGRHVDLSDFEFPVVRENPTLTFGGVLRGFDEEAGRRLDAQLGADDLRFSPLDLRRVLLVSRTFFPSNVAVLRRYGVWVPPCEPRDLYWAMPVRKNVRRTEALRFARTALAKYDASPV